MKLKKEKNFEVADAVRNELSVLGISLMDTINGTVWEKIINFSHSVLLFFY